jgi:hypothetical protein
MDSFTYIIRSDNRDSGDAFDCRIQLGGLPTKYKSFLVETIGFYADVNPYFELYSDNFPISNGYDTKTKSLHVLYSTVLLGHSVPMVYKVDNFNGQYINFQLLDNANALINTATDWRLYLKLTGIEE